MLTLDPLAASAPQEPHDLLATPATNETATPSRGCPDTCSVHDRPTLTLQRQLIAGLVG